jgi:hypothetical protein
VLVRTGQAMCRKPLPITGAVGTSINPQAIK